MPASPARIGFSLQPHKITSYENPAVAARHGEGARRTGSEPVKTYFDNADDAEIYSLARGNLLSKERRRFGVEIIGEQFVEFTENLPTMRVVSAKRSMDRSCIIVGGQAIDLEDGTTILDVWG